MPITKTFDNVDFKVEDGSRTIIATISTDAIDRHGEIVLPKGLKKKNYAGNPVVMVNHDYTSLPVGKSLWVRSDGKKIIAKAYITDKTQLGRDAFALVQDGILNAASIGFDAVKSESGPPSTKEIQHHPEWKGATGVYRNWELLEWSLVAIPANQEALMMAVSKGYSPETLKFLSQGGKLSLTKTEPDCWQWADAEYQEELPLPKYAQNWADVCRKLDRLIESTTADAILDKYRGKC
jgi:HK97 family phage prohead protease